MSAGRPARFIWAVPSRRSQPRSVMSVRGRCRPLRMSSLPSRAFSIPRVRLQADIRHGPIAMFPMDRRRMYRRSLKSRIERYAPGFREVILARNTLTAAAMEQYNPNYVGGDINGGLQDLSSALYPAHCFFSPLPDIGKKYLSLFFLHPPRRRRSRALRLLCLAESGPILNSTQPTYAYLQKLSFFLNIAYGNFDASTSFQTEILL